MTQIIAHRGASVAAQENTVEAFELAVEMGADAIELDVRSTADGRLVIHHDPTLPDGRSIAALTLRELPDWLPTLESGLTACAGVAVNVEIKHDPLVENEDGHDRHVDAVMAALLAFGDGRLTRRWLISSFRFATVERVTERYSGARAALLVEHIDQAAIDQAAAIGCDGINPDDASTTANMVAAAHLAGLQVAVWTVDDANRISELLHWGVDAIFTNVPDIGLGLRER